MPPGPGRPRARIADEDGARHNGFAGVMRGPSVWRDLELGAPVIARLATVRLTATGVALLGTVRRRGGPRISPVEPYFVDGQLLMGAMSPSGKIDDLRRDPRYVLHSAVTGPDNGEGEFKLYGSVHEVAADVRDAAVGAWWSAFPADKAVVFALAIDRAAFIEWDIGHGRMTVHRWSPRSGYRRDDRSYP